MKKSDFFKKFGHLLLTVNNDDTETGDFMLFSPEEKYIVAEYLNKGYSIVSVFEVENDEDNVELDNDISHSPYKIGFLIMKNQN